MAKQRRPNKKTVAAVVAWLESMDMCVYGPCMDKEGTEIGALMDYGIEEIECRVAHIKHDTLVRYTNPIE